MMNGSKTRYPFLMRFLHWLSAVVILWATGSGFYILFARPSESVVNIIADFNVALTLLFVPVFAMRVILRCLWLKPVNNQLLKHQQKLADIGHGCLYVTVSVVLISGVLMMERDMTVFGWFEVGAILTNGHLTEVFSKIHRVANVALFILLFVHILAVIKHELSGIPMLRKMV